MYAECKFTAVTHQQTHIPCELCNQQMSKHTYTAVKYKYSIGNEKPRSSIVSIRVHS